MSEAIIQPIEGEPMRFYVASRRRGVEPWLVDVEDGECACPDHQINKNRCWHIEQASAFVVNRSIAEFKEIGEQLQYE